MRSLLALLAVVGLRFTNGNRLSYLIAGNSSSSSSPTVTTPLGTVQGVYSNNGTVAAYYGIPYAQPPVGNLRFAYAEPAQAWNGTLQATSDPPLCIQYTGTGVTGSEDCLHVNVYVPTATPPADGFPVYAFVPGGVLLNELLTRWNNV